MSENFEYSYDYSPNYDENFTIPIYFNNEEDEIKLLILISETTDFLEQLNIIFSIIALIFNFLHFLVMIQRKMWGSSINILMVGVVICDIVIIGYTVGSWVYLQLSMDKCWPQDTYLSRLILLITEFFTNTFLRVSPWLGLSMAIIRATVLLYPFNQRISKLSGRPDGLRIMVLVFGMSFGISGFLMARFSIFKNGLWEAPDGCQYPSNFTQTKYIVLVGRKIIFTDKVSLYIYELVNGASYIIPATLYPIIAGILIRQLWKMRKNHQKLFSQRGNFEKDHTTKLVILMTITFFITLFPAGLAMWLRYLFPFHTVIQAALDRAKILTSVIFTVNATCHCLIFATLSSQYREVAKEVFWCGKRKVATVSTGSGMVDSMKI